MKNRKVRLFIYALIAWFVGMAVIVCYIPACYAATSDVVPDDRLHWYQVGKDTSISHESSYDSLIDKVPYGDGISSTDYKYMDKFFYAIDHYTYAEGQAYTFGYNDGGEIVAFTSCNPSSQDVEFGFYLISVKQFRASFYSYDCVKNGEPLARGAVTNFYAESKYTINNESFYCLKMEYSSSYNDFIIGYNTGKLKVFKDAQSAYNYLKNGDMSGLAWQGASKQYDGENIYLDNFEMWVHDSNAYSAYYLEFKYTIPEQLRNAASLKLDIAESFEWCVGLIANTMRIPKTYSGTNTIDLLEYPTGFKLYLSDIDAVTDLVGNTVLSNLTRRAVLGSNVGFVDLSALSIDGINGEKVGKVTNSKLYLTCYVVADGTYGQSVSGSVDFLSGANGIGTYTPNASGEYKYNGDYKENGHYETKVTVDDSGNQDYTYYYYSTDNSKKEITAKDSHDNTYTSISPPSGGSSGSVVNNITMPDHIFVNLSGSGGGSSDIPDVTIEDDDLTFDSLRDSIKDGYGLIDDTDTAAKGDGLVAMLSDLFGYLPAKFVGLIMLGTSSVVGIAILRMIFKR